MNIGAMSSQLALNNTLSDVGVAMLSKTMNAQKVEGQGIVNMINDVAAMERSVNPAVGSNFDMSV